MTPSDSLHLDEHLARFLAAYDQGIGTGDGHAPTLDVSAIAPNLGIDERLVEPLSGAALNQGSLDDLLPDSRGIDPYLALSPSSALPETHRIGRFELRKQLGKGGCGIVFLAYDPKLKREVALKIPRPELLMSTDARRRLLREATAAAAFDHPNLVPVYETGEIGPVCFIATVFCPGQTLADWLDRQAFPVPIRQAARLVAQLAEAVQHAHDRSVLHRDLKPNNVILQEVKSDPNAQDAPPGSCPLRGDYFIPRVVDFGLAKLTDQGPSETVTRQILGTPKYMAPEQAQARHDDVGPEADVYALGVILYEMLVGRTPYEGASDVEVLRLSIEGNLTLPRSLRKEISRDLEAICLKAMARTPVRRYRTAIDLADDLRRFLEGLPTLARPLNGVGRAARWLRRNDQAFALAVLTTICCALLALGILNAYQARRFRVDKSESQVRDAQRVRLDAHREYSRHVRDGFLAWQAGDTRQMAESLREARLSAGVTGDRPEFAGAYLAQLGKSERASVACPAGPALALAIAPDRPWIATGHADGTIAIWNRDTGEVVGSVKAHQKGVAHVAFLAGGSKIVTTGEEPLPRVWSIDAKGTLKPEASLPPLDSPISVLAVSSNGKVLVLGGRKGECVAWDVVGNTILRKWMATGGEPLMALAIAPDGKTMASAGNTEPVRIWELGRDAAVGDLLGASGTTVLAFAPNEAAGWWLAAASVDGTVRLFDRQRREVRALAGHAGPIHGLSASPDGSLLASAGEDDGVCVWNAATGVKRMLLRGHERPVRGVGFAPDGRTLHSTGDDGQLKTWDLTAEPEGTTFRGLPAAITSLATRPDTPDYGAAYADGSVELFAKRGSPPRRFPAQGRTPLTLLRFPETGPPLGVELAGRSVAVWEFGDAPRAAFRTEIAGTAADLNAYSNTLAIGDDRGHITVYSLADRTVQSSFHTGLAAPMRHLAFSDNGRWLAAQTADHAIGIWFVGDPTLRYKLPGHGDGTWLVRFIGNERLATAGRGSSIKVWNISSGKEELTLLGHVGRISGMAIAPDLRTLVSGSATGDVKLWDLRTGQELIGLRRHSGPVFAAEFSSDGRTLLTGGRGELSFWDSAQE